MVGWLTIFLVYLFTNGFLFCLSNSLVIYYLLTRVLDLQSVWRSLLDEHGTVWKGNMHLSFFSKTVVMLVALFSEQEESSPETDNFRLGDT